MRGYEISVWTPEADATLTGLWAAGKTATDIGKLMGATKDSIIGRRRRLKLPGRPPVVHPSRALQIDFCAVHKMREARTEWGYISKVVGHPTEALKKWYHSKAASLGVPPVKMARTQPKTRKAPRPSKPAPIFTDVHKAREAREVWESIAIRVGFSKNGLKKWYAKECLRRGIKPVALQWKATRHSDFSFFKNEPIPPAQLPAPISGGVLYEFMPRGGCHWPLNDARPWRMCGDPAGRNVYCGDHTIDADQKKQAERRRRLECSRVVMVGEVAA